MTLNEMQNAWNSPRNDLPTSEQKQLAQKFASRMIRRRRFESIWLTNTFVWLSAATVVAIRAIVMGKTSPLQEWGLFPLLVVPWGFAIHFLRRHLKPVEPMKRGDTPVVESFRSALASNLENQLHMKLVGALYVIIIPLLALVMRQLHAIGKVSERELISMASFFGGILLISVIVAAIRYVAHLQPQQKQLSALLTQLAD